MSSNKKGEEYLRLLPKRAY